MLATNHTGYVQGNAASTAVAAEPSSVDHGRLKKEYLAYLDNKNEEIKEQQNARRYYHGAQWTEKQVKAFGRRKQPVVTYNRIGRKINAVVGLLERQKQDPRGFPRTPKHEEGAEVATATLRYVCDEQDWSSKSPICGLNGAVDGLAGVEIIIEAGDQGDPEVGLEVVDPSSFFYDPRSLKMDFSDARFMGVGKWADIDTTIEMFPDKENEIRASIQSGAELTSNPDTDNKWFSTGENGNRIRIIDHWYIKGSEWHWCIYTGSTILADGVSYLRDQKKKTICKYIMYSANIDHEGDRYGFVRNMRSSQDEINQRRSKGLHINNSRRVIIPEGTGADLENIRREAARPDGVITYPAGSQPPTFDDAARGNELQGQLAFLEDAKNEIENYGFNPALMGQGVDNLSGRAMQIQQQAGIAELGPYLIAFRGWKIRVYRAIWSAIQQHWTSERWIRVTDDEDVAQFFSINQMGIDPNTGMPALVNALGSLDVDIIIDEGPDTINMQQDAYDTLSIMATKGQNVPPQLLIELSPLQGKVKKKALDILEKAAQQPNPIQEAGAKAEIAEKEANAFLRHAQGQKALAEAGQPPAGPQPDQPPSDIDVATALAEIRNKDANSQKQMAETARIRMETMVRPVEAVHQISEADASRQERLTVHQDQMKQVSQDRSRHP
jgi:hypothetical protein